MQSSCFARSPPRSGRGDVVSFTVPGKPYAQPRHRTTKTGRTYTPTEARDYQAHVALRARSARALSKGPFPISGGVEVKFVAYFPRPVSALKRLFPWVKPDIDNLEKAILDGINHSGVWHDDAQVCHVDKWKLYAADPADARVEVFVTRLTYLPTITVPASIAP